MLQIHYLVADIVGLQVSHLLQQRPLRRQWRQPR